MIAAATWPREHPEQERLLHIDAAADVFADTRVGALPSLLSEGDLLVVNDAATVPASLRAERQEVAIPSSAACAPDGATFEVRLLAQRGPATWWAVIFGAGDWREKTEKRSAPPELPVGERISLAGGRTFARVSSVDARSPRLVQIEFEGGAVAMWRAIYKAGRPVQYAYMRAPLALWHVQSAFAARPWAVEFPSAGRPLTSTLLASLRQRGVAVAALTHAAGLSSTGDPTLDARLPLAEHYDIPKGTIEAIDRARRGGQQVVAVGTTVVRALEGCALAHDGRLVHGEGSTELRVVPDTPLRVASALFTGVHEEGTSHFDVMRAFAGAGKTALLRRALRHAERAGYLQHEFGDSILIVAPR